MDIDMILVDIDGCCQLPLQKPLQPFQPVLGAVRLRKLPAAWRLGVDAVIEVPQRIVTYSISTRV